MATSGNELQTCTKKYIFAPSRRRRRRRRRHLTCHNHLHYLYKFPLLVAANCLESTEIVRIERVGALYNHHSRRRQQHSSCKLFEFEREAKLMYCKSVVAVASRRPILAA